jgi:hypothetical protein
MTVRTMPGFAPVPGTPLAEQDPRGRFDVMAARAARHVVNGIEQRTGIEVWSKGLGDVVEAFIGEYVPSKAYTAVELARNVGILKPEKRVKRIGTR